MIKKIVCIALAVFLLSKAGTYSYAQPLFTYGSKKVMKEEFLSAFEKNPDSGNRAKAMAGYLDLYINYKLKVQDAYDHKMDTLPGIKKEKHFYRSQLEQTFLSSKTNTAALVQEAFERSQKDVLITHLFIAFNPNDSISQLNAAKQAELAALALKKNTDFTTVIKQYATDVKDKKTGGQAGWITVFTLPYRYETAIYNLSIGGVSQLLKGSTGYHFFKKIQERPAEGIVQVAQILLMAINPTDEISNKNKKQAIDSLHKLIENGADFATVAEQSSQDRTSFRNGGIMPEFGVGKYDSVFEKQAFSLKNIGDVSVPFQTAYGWHIIKLIKKEPINTNKAEVEQALLQRVLGEGRTEKNRKQYIESQISKMNFTQGKILSPQLWAYTDSAIKGFVPKSVPELAPVFSFGKKPVTVAEWVQYAKSEKMAGGKKMFEKYPALMQDFILFSAEDYLRRNLDKVDTNFARQINEFNAANMLFEVMDKKVWTKATVDTTALKRYYLQHTNRYIWGESAHALMITAASEAVGNEVYRAIKAHPADWAIIVSKYATGLLADSGRFDIAQIEMPVGEKPTGETLTTLVKNATDSSITFAYIFSVVPGGEQRSFDDAKGFVINDYQKELEQKWLAILRKKYPVKVNKAVWHKLQKSNN